MPELPDVEQFCRYFNTNALHQRIRQVHVQSPRLLVDTSPQGLGRALKKRCFQSAQRHGKYLFAKTDGEKYLVLHFGMSGELQYTNQDSCTPDYTQLGVEFENGYQLAYVAPRKLGRIALTDSPQAWIKQRSLGPDALEVSEQQFIEKAAGSRGSVKSWLMDQHIIAGIGNYYSDEILYHAGIHPKRVLTDLDTAALKRLYRALRSVLKTAVEREADPKRLPHSFLLSHRKPGGHCPTCGTSLARTKVAGRTAWYCPHCQKS